LGRLVSRRTFPVETSQARRFKHRREIKCGELNLSGEFFLIANFFSVTPLARRKVEWRQGEHECALAQLLASDIFPVGNLRVDLESSGKI
jgi:hypothetical protein